jgi:nitrite reductase/ring-hydroxylating ferredoxin subunit
VGAVGAPSSATGAAQDLASDGQSRRAVIVGGGVAVVAGVAGFAWYRAAGPKPRTATGGTTVPAPNPAQSGTATTLAPLSDVPENGGIVLQDEQIVLTRGAGNTVHGFTAVCTHQGCLVSQVRNGQITCPCHGSAFDATTGAVTHGPAEQPLGPVAVSVVNGSVVTG